MGHKHFLIGITRVRNEALILRDTLDYVGTHVDAIVAYDDASTDRTLEILGGHPKVALIVTNRLWEADIEARRIAEGRHRGLLLQTAREQLQSDWIFCFDPDERVTGDLRGFIEGTHSSDYDGVRGSTVRRLYDPWRSCTLSSRARTIGLSSFLRPGTARHSDVVAKPVGGHLREAPWARAGRRRTRGDRSLLPTLW
jgi:hypothetical protein